MGKPNAHRTLSHHGAVFIAGFEGWRAEPYNDAVGYATIGYGHLIAERAVTAADRAHWGTITKERGLQLLHDDAAAPIKAIRDLVSVPISQERFDALVSWLYNVGAGSLAGSTLLSDLNRGRYGSVPSELLKWDRAGGHELEGLKRRREAEAQLWSTGRYA